MTPEKVASIEPDQSLQTGLQAFVGTKIVLAERMTRQAFHEKYRKLEERCVGGEEQGYHVVYPSDGAGKTYHSWSPTRVFRNAYRELTPGEVLFVETGGPEA